MSKTKPSYSLRIDDRTRTAIKPDGTKIPVVDAKYSTLIQPSPDDIKKGIPGDHANCMYCLACRRQFGSELVWVTRTLAYVELKVKKGKSVLERFILTAPAKANIRDFDATEDVTEEAVVFAAPSPSRTLDGKAKAHARWKAKKLLEAKKAYVVGTKPVEQKTNHKKADTVGTMRNRAYGMFQFKPIQAQKELGL